MTTPFQSLLKTLQNRFDNKRLIVNTHINELLLIEKLYNESAKDLRSLIDQLQKHLRALKLLKLDLDKSCETILNNIILQKLDKESRRQFEKTLTSHELIKWNTFITFLEQRCQVLENKQSKNSQQPVKLKVTFPNKPRTLVTKISNPSSKCPACNISNHLIYKCKSFLDLNAIERFSFVKKMLRVCLACLRYGHKLATCRQLNYLCKLCPNDKYNYLLHRTDNLFSSTEPKELNKNIVVQSDSAGTAKGCRSSLADIVSKNAFASACLLTKSKCVLLSTASFCAK